MGDLVTPKCKSYPFFCNICNATHYEGLTAKCGASFFLINFRVQINWNKSVSFFKKGILGMRRMISFVWFSISIWSLKLILRRSIRLSVHLVKYNSKHSCSNISQVFTVNWYLRPPLVYCFYRSLTEACCLYIDKKLRQTHGVIFRIFHVSFQISQGTAIGHRRYSC